ncbi:collagen-like triple helix repeat-containing protein [Oceanobacillus indicireducens]|uniref:Collagen-like protein n=1 Tax=Oceanobacillus indicireducens TaxID=1004261 RepID=A0A917Y388_9BACI|nr:collagen-like protein [Oceanobacillus indicireducens]GGN64298.1 hypothetical protein GCM10007971_32020 [Oceanobacillus indicireducens]
MATKEELKERLVTGHVITEEDVHDLIDVAGKEGPQGPKGDTGAKGAKGDKGDKGEPGADGFPSETQWNELVARVEALEGAGAGE